MQACAQQVEAVRGGGLCRAELLDQAGGIAGVLRVEQIRGAVRRLEHGAGVRQRQLGGAQGGPEATQVRKVVVDHVTVGARERGGAGSDHSIELTKHGPISI